MRGKHKVSSFGEKVSYQMKLPANGKDAISTDKSGKEYFVGNVNRNMSYVVSTLAGIVACSMVRRLTDEKVYDPFASRKLPCGLLIASMGKQ